MFTIPTFYCLNLGFIPEIKLRTMFEGFKRRLENTISELQKMEQERKDISISFSPDADGYLDRECPNQDCLFRFKAHSDDWKNLFKDEQVFCPMCRHEAKATSWWNSDQLKAGRTQVIQQVQKRFMNAWAGRSSIGYSFTPVGAMKEMERKITCTECHSRFAVIGSAFFCPCCGYNSAEQTFDASLNKVEIKLNYVTTVRKAVETSSKDDAEIMCRSLIEDALKDCVVAFQRFCEATYQKRKPDEKLAMNVFQRLDTGSKLWKGIYNEEYADWLTTLEFQRMNLLFQRRHLLAHTEGVVDERYLQYANDTAYKLGQRIVVKESDVIELLKYIRKISEKIREKGQAFAS